MTWLHLTIPALLLAALWSGDRASDWFGAEGLAHAKGKINAREAIYMLVRGWLWLLATLFLAGAGGFVWGRLL